jgi:hypothetical protein
VIRRYLRIYYMEPDGELVGEGGIVSNVIMPAMAIPGTTLRAGKVALLSSKRRNAAVTALATELRRRRPRFLGLGLVLCESAQSGEGKVARRFVGSFAALGDERNIFAGDVTAPTLAQTTTAMAAEMLGVLRERKGARRL